MKYNRIAEDDTDGAVPGVDLPNNRLGFFTIATDCAAVVLPLGLIVFIIIVWRLDGSESTESFRGDWRNIITVVSTKLSHQNIRGNSRDNSNKRT